MYTVFRRHSCLSCGIIDWIEDFIYMLKDIEINAEIEDIEFHNSEGYIRVVLRILDIDMSQS